MSVVGAAETVGRILFQFAAQIRHIVGRQNAVGVHKHQKGAVGLRDAVIAGRTATLVLAKMILQPHKRPSRFRLFAARHCGAVFNQNNLKTFVCLVFQAVEQFFNFIGAVVNRYDY